MSSNPLRAHRVVIASLFLPHTVVVGQPSGKSTPDANPGRKSREIDPSEVSMRIRQAPQDRLDSIVEYINRATNPVESTASPASDVTIPGPFAKLASAPSRQPPARKRTLSRSNIRRSSSRRDSRPAVPNDTQDPEYFHFEKSPHCNGGLKNAVDSVSGTDDRPDPARLRKKLWIGALGAQGQNSFSSSLKSSIATRLRSAYESEPVWVDDTVFQNCYDGFCHSVLWGVMHYIPDFPSAYSKFASLYEDYIKVNKLFSETILSVSREGDIIWINDYHLMLVPGMLRASGKLPQGVTVGYFSHISFPSSEIFRCLPMRESLLKGVLGADLIGFQTLNYARHFRQTVSRILSVEAVPRGVQLDADFDPPLALPPSSPLPHSENVHKGRFVEISVVPIGIDVWQLEKRKRESEVTEWISVLRERYHGMKILVGRDKLDEIQGVRHKIEAFGQLLESHPEYQGQIVLIQIALPSSAPDTYSSLANGQPHIANPYSVSSTILKPISDINSRFSTLTYTPIVFLHTQDVSFSQYLALLRVADAFVVTSHREGMALRAHEFVIMQEPLEGDERVRKGNLILSEFTGSYSYRGFRSCIAVNPWDTRGTAEAFHKALSMPDEEAETRWEDLHHHVVSQSAQAFVTGFLTRCLRATVNGERGSAVKGYGRHNDSYGFTENFKDGMTKLKGKWKNSERRLIFLDWEGTLVPSHPTLLPEEAMKSETDKAITILRALSKDKNRNEVWVLSGLSMSGTLQRVSEKVPNIGIVAENGCFIMPRIKSGGKGWVNMVASINMSWKGPCLEMLQYFTERTPGSIIEERQASIVWRFWTGVPDSDCGDRQWARRQAAEAQNHIFDSLGERYSLRIVPGANSFLVIPNHVSRSTAVGSILRTPSHSASLGSPSSVAHAHEDTSFQDDAFEDVDFLLTLGGEERLIRRLNELDDAETVSTSAKGTDAKWVLEREDVSFILNKFAEM